MRIALVLASALLAGCDVAVVAGLAISSARDDGSSSSSAPSVPPAPPPDTSYHVWIGSVADAAAEEAALQAADGVPDPLVWTKVGSATGSAVFDPSQAPGSFNAILVQAGSAQVYHVDGIEVLSGTTVVETAAAPVRSGQFASPANLTGTPDGLAADTTAAPGTYAFLFSLYATPVDRFRVNAWGAARGPGDVEWTATWSDAGNESAGGAAADAAGTLYLTASDAAGANRDVRLLRFDAAGAALPVTTVSTAVSAASGSHDVAVHTDGSVTVAATVGAGNILVRRYAAGLASTPWTVTYDSGFGVDRVEAHGVAVDSAGNAIVAGGTATALNGIDPWIRKFAAADGATLWTQTPPALPVDSADTYWRGVTLDPGDEVYSTGDLTSTASGFIEIVTRRSAGSNGAAAWSDLFGDNQPAADLGRALAVDGAGNVHVGGHLGTAAQGRNGTILKYIPGGFLTSLITIDDQNALDDEVLDLAAEPDGTIYACGYETVPGQGRNLWVRKYDPQGGLVWIRTYDGGFGDDLAASLVLSGSSLLVAGSRTEPGGETNIHVRRYAK